MGYFGILPPTWQAYGGTQFAPTAGGATWAEQVQIAESIQANPPDVGGCSGAW